jgi:hypothetical protein
MSMASSGNSAMIFLTLIFCWGLGTGNCESVPGITPFKSEASCSASARQLAADWLREHEAKWHLIGWTCGPPPEEES